MTDKDQGFATKSSDTSSSRISFNEDQFHDKLVACKMTTLSLAFKKSNEIILSSGRSVYLQPEIH